MKIPQSPLGWEVPAAHSTDTSWFAVDADGEVAVFETGEPGPVPAMAVRNDEAASELVEECRLAGRAPAIDDLAEVPPGTLRQRGDRDEQDVALVELAREDDARVLTSWIAADGWPTTLAVGPRTVLLWDLPHERLERLHSWLADGRVVRMITSPPLGGPLDRFGAHYYECEDYSGWPAYRLALPAMVPLRLDALVERHRRAAVCAPLPHLRFARHDELAIHEHLHSVCWGEDHDSWPLPRPWQAPPELDASTLGLIGRALETGDLAVLVDRLLETGHPLAGPLRTGAARPVPDLLPLLPEEAQRGAAFELFGRALPAIEALRGGEVAATVEELLELRGAWEAGALGFDDLLAARRSALEVGIGDGLATPEPRLLELAEEASWWVAAGGRGWQAARERERAAQAEVIARALADCR